MQSLQAPSVFVISHRHDRGLWGPPASRPREITAFRQRGDAEAIAARLWKYKLQKLRWPGVDVAEGGMRLLAPDGLPAPFPSPLAVEEVDMDWLVGRARLTSLAVSVVGSLRDGEAHTSLDAQLVVPAGDAPAALQAGWLSKLFKQPAARK